MSMFVRFSAVRCIALAMLFSVASINTADASTLVPYTTVNLVDFAGSNHFWGGGTPSGYAEPVPYGAENNDSDGGWIWTPDRNGNGSNGHLTVNFGAPLGITSFRMYSSFNGDDRGADLAVEYSDDGSNYIPDDNSPVSFLTTFGGGVDDNGDPKPDYGGWYEFEVNPNETPYQYWRISHSGNNTLDHMPRVAEVEFYAESFTQLPPPTLHEWISNATGIWTDNSSWSPGESPNSTLKTARFGTHANIVGPTTAVVHADVTVNRIEFESATNRYSIAGLGSVNLAMNTSTAEPASLDNLAGHHEFQARLNLLSDTFLNVSSDSILEFNHQVDLGGNTVIKTGPGSIAFNNDLSSGSGGTVMCEDGSCTGTGTINGDLVNGGTLSPGNLSGVSSVPEPATLIFLASGIVLLVSCRRERSQ